MLFFRQYGTTPPKVVVKNSMENVMINTVRTHDSGPSQTYRIMSSILIGHTAKLMMNRM